jgi:heme-degrading monooxygenase HmoA
MASFLSLCSARYESLPGRAPVGEQAPQGSAVFVAGTDAEYPASGIPQRRKTERHWLAVWSDEGAVDRFLSSPATYLSQLDGAHDVCGLKLIPYMQRGAEILALDVHRTRPKPDEAIAIITSIGPYTSESDVIAAGQKARAARQSLAHADGLTRELLLIPYPLMATDLFTVTAWSSERAAQAWAYRTDSHRAAIDFHKTASEKARVSFTRCIVGGSFGDWRQSGMKSISG